MAECEHYGERQNWRQDGGDMLRERSEVHMLLLPPKKVSLGRTTVWSLCRCRLSPAYQAYHWASGSPWLRARVNAQDEEMFAFWIGPPRRTTAVFEAIGDPAGDGLWSMLLPQDGMKPKIHVDASSWCHCLMPLVMSSGFDAWGRGRGRAS